jgi:hypothetical protein
MLILWQVRFADAHIIGATGHSGRRWLILHKKGGSRGREQTVRQRTSGGDRVRYPQAANAI